MASKKALKIKGNQVDFFVLHVAAPMLHVTYDAELPGYGIDKIAMK